MYNSPRCHLDSCYDSMPFQDTNISPATDVCARHEILSLQASAFPHALSGPFNSLHFQPFSAPGLSVSASTVFISTSTVCVPLFIFYYITPSLKGCQVLFSATDNSSTDNLAIDNPMTIHKILPYCPTPAVLSLWQ